MILMTLCFDFITNASREVKTFDILWSSFSRLSTQGGSVSYGIFALLITTWLVGAFLWVAEEQELSASREWLNAILGILLVSMFISILYAFWHAGGLSAIASRQVTSVEELMVQVGELGSMVTRIFFSLLVLVLGFAIAGTLKEGLFDRSANSIAIVSSLVGILFVVFAVQTTNIQIIQADVVFKMAEPFNTPGQWPIATQLYQRSLELAPSEDHYYLFLGRSYLEQAKEQTDINQQGLLMSQAENDLKRAQRLNPLNTDHTANLARLYTWWASGSNSLDEKNSRAEKASEYYELATMLSPNNATLWGEWATLLMDVMDNYEQAKTTLEHALTVDPEFNYIYGLLGNYELGLSRKVSDIELRKEHINTAIMEYEKAIAVSTGRDASTKVNYMLSKGNAHIELALVDPAGINPDQIFQAINMFKSVVEMKPPTIRLWQLHEQIARLYLQVQDPASALPHLQTALAEAPDSQKSRLEELYKQAFGQP